MRLPSPTGELPKRHGPDVFMYPFILQGPGRAFSVHKEHPVTLAEDPAKARGELCPKEQGFKANPKPGLRKVCMPAPAKLACLSALNRSPLTVLLPFCKVVTK